MIFFDADTWVAGALLLDVGLILVERDNARLRRHCCDPARDDSDIVAALPDVCPQIRALRTCVLSPPAGRHSHGRWADVPRLAEWRDWSTAGTREGASTSGGCPVGV